MDIANFEVELLALAKKKGPRRVRTAEGAKRFGAPIGTIITADMEAAVGSSGGAASNGGSGSEKASGIDKVSTPRPKMGKASEPKQGKQPQVDPKTSSSAKPKKSLNLTVKPSTLSGNQHFTVGTQKYAAPQGSRLIKSKTNQGLVYVATPEGKIHAFNSAGEVEIPQALESVFANKFHKDFQGDDAYELSEFENAEDAPALDTLPAGTTLLDSEGTPHFTKQDDGSWMHSAFGLTVQDSDIADAYNSGELMAEPVADVPEDAEVGADQPDTTFSRMEAPDVSAALSAMKPGQKVVLKNDTAGIDKTFTKNDKGLWDSGSGNPATSKELSFLKAFLSKEKPSTSKEAYSPLDATEADPLDSTSTVLPGEGDTPTADWVSTTPPGSQATYVNDTSGKETEWTKQPDGSWLNQKNGEMSSEGMEKAVANLSDTANFKITKVAKPVRGKQSQSTDRAAEKPEVETEKPEVETEKPEVETEKPEVETEKPELDLSKYPEGTKTYTENELNDLPVGQVVEEYSIEDPDGDVLSWEKKSDGKWYATDDFGNDHDLESEFLADTIPLLAAKAPKPEKRRKKSEKQAEPQDEVDTDAQKPGVAPYSEAASVEDIDNAAPGDTFVLESGDLITVTEDGIVDDSDTGYTLEELKEWIPNGGIFKSDTNSKTPPKKKPTREKSAPTPKTPETPEVAGKHALIDHPDAKKVGAQAGSNAGGLYELPMPDGSTQRYYVKKAQTEDHGKNEALANALYAELGVKAPEVDFESDGNIYSKIVDGDHDMTSQLKNAEWLDKVRRDFAVDAWLSNRDVFGLTNDNILTDAEGNPWRIDNGGALRYRAMGAPKKDFGNEVTELDVFRTGKKAKVFGSDMTKEQELDGVNRIVALTPERIDELVSQSGMDAGMADTLKARREYIAEAYGITLPENQIGSKEDSDTADVPEGVPAGAEKIPQGTEPSWSKEKVLYESIPDVGVVSYTPNDDDTYTAELPSGLKYENAEKDEIWTKEDEGSQFYSTDASESAEADADKKSWSVGDVPLTVEDLDSLPVGAVMTYQKNNGTQSVYVKNDEVSWISPGGAVLASQTLKNAAKSGKFSVTTLPESETSSDDGFVTDIAELDALPDGSKFELVHNSTKEHLSFVTKKNGVWQNDAGDTYNSDDINLNIKHGAVKHVQSDGEDSEDVASDELTKQLWPNGPVFSEKQITEAFEALESHSSFQVAYGFKSLPDDHPLKDGNAQNYLKEAALSEFPDLKAKPAVVAYLKQSVGHVDAEPTVEDDEDGSVKIVIGSKVPTKTGVQGVDGGEYTKKEIQEAIDILEAYSGKLFKSELGKKGSPLGELNPNDIVGFDKDKLVTKQKFIDLLKAKLVRLETDTKHPRVKYIEELDVLPVGSVISIQTSPTSSKDFFRKIGDDQWIQENIDFSHTLQSSHIATNITESKWDVRVDKKPDVVPEYAKTPAAVVDKEVSEIDVANFTKDDIESAPVGTELVSGNSELVTFKKVSENGSSAWQMFDGSNHTTLGFSSHEMTLFWDSQQLSLKQKDGPEFNANESSGIVPGKYTTENGKAYMVVSADGSGVYVDTSGNVKKLTKNAVKKNYDSGMQKFHGMPDEIPTVSAPTAKAPAKPKTVADIPDGVYFSGNPNNPKTSVYQVDGDTVQLFAPNTDATKVTHLKVGNNPTQTWGDFVGQGATIEYDYISQWNLPEGLQDLASTYDITATKNADGKWVFKNKTGTELATSTAPIYGYYGKIKTHGLSPAVKVPKAKANTLFSKGKLTDENGNSVVPDGYTGDVFFFGSQTSMHALSEVKKLLDSNPTPKDSDIWKLGVKPDATLVTKLSEIESDTKKDTIIKQVNAMLDGVVVDAPESKSAELFDWNEFGEAMMPTEILLEPMDYSHVGLGKRIKLISSFFGDGKIIGQHLSLLDSTDRKYWLTLFMSGKFDEMYKLEVQAAAKKGLAHKSGYLHPGYSSNTDTAKIAWAAAVPGEVSALKSVEGDWSSSVDYASQEEISNYLIAAKMQNPEYLTLSEKRSWYNYHRQNSKEMVDKLSVVAQHRKESGEEPKSDPLTWTDDVKPGKSYDKVFEESPTPWPNAMTWNQNAYEAKVDWYNDNKDNEDFVSWKASSDYADLSDDDLQGSPYSIRTMVLAYFEQRAAEYEEEMKKPVYSKTNKIDAGSHEVWFVENQFGAQYVFKPARNDAQVIRLQMEAEAMKLSRVWGYKTPYGQMIEIDGQLGLLQDRVPSVSDLVVGVNDDGSMKYMDLSTMNDDQLSTIASEHVLDWMLDNDDGHPENFLVNSEGQLTGIDKGRAFYVYGNWNGLSGDEKAHSVFSEKSPHQTLTYTLLYDDIRSGKISKESAEAIYLKTRKAAIRIQKSSDASVAKHVQAAVEGRTNWDVPDYMNHFDGKAPTNADELVAAVLERKNSVVSDIEAMWEKIFSDAGYGSLPEPPAKVFEEHYSGWEEPGLMEAVSETKVWGTSPMHSNASIQGGSSLLWTEKTKSGGELVRGQFKLGGIAQKKLVKLLSSKTGDESAPSTVDGFPNTGDWKSSISAAAKTITENAADKAYDSDALATFDNVKSTIETDLQHWSTELTPDASGNIEFPSGKKVSVDQLPLYRAMLDHYQEQIAKVDSAKSDGGTTSKQDFTVFVPWASAPKPVIWVDPDGVTYTPLANGQWLSSNGVMSTTDPTPSGGSAEGWKTIQSDSSDPVVYTLQSAKELTGDLGVNGQKTSTGKESGAGHDGREYRMTLPTGELITFRNASSTQTSMSQQGRLTFRLAGDDTAASLSRVQEHLASLGIDVSGADSDESAQLVYWREMFGRVLFSNTSQASKSIKSVREKLEAKQQELKNSTDSDIDDFTFVEGLGLSMTPDEELSYWRTLANEAWGEDKVSSWIAEGRHMPKYQHLNLSDPTQNTGLPYYERIDVDSDELKSKNTLLAIGNNGKDDSLLAYLKSGGMISTEERLRIMGAFKQGASSSADQGSGGASSVFTRIAHPGSSALTQGSIYGDHVAYWSPELMKQTGTYSYDSDLYGKLSHQKNKNNYDPLKSLKDHSSAGNETMVPNTLSVYDFLEIMVFQNAEKRNEAIQIMKSLGFSSLRGVPIEERFIMRVDLKKTLDRVKNEWKN